MSKKYEHRIKSLKDQKQNKGKNRRRSKPEAYKKSYKLSKEKKTINGLHKKIEKSKKIW